MRLSHGPTHFPHPTLSVSEKRVSKNPHFPSKVALFPPTKVTSWGDSEGSPSPLSIISGAWLTDGEIIRAALSHRRISTALSTVHADDFHFCDFSPQKYFVNNERRGGLNPPLLPLLFVRRPSFSPPSCSSYTGNTTSPEITESHEKFLPLHTRLRKRSALPHSKRQELIVSEGRLKSHFSAPFPFPPEWAIFAEGGPCANWCNK